MGIGLGGTRIIPGCYLLLFLPHSQRLSRLGQIGVPADEFIILTMRADLSRTHLPQLGQWTLGLILSISVFGFYCHWLADLHWNERLPLAAEGYLTFASSTDFSLWLSGIYLCVSGKRIFPCPSLELDMDSNADVCGMYATHDL